MLDLTASPLAEALRECYRLERELGRGGMATVYLARDRKHERSVALKVVHPEVAIALGAERFLREIRLTAQLHHPHILPLLDSGEAAGQLWYTMPYVEGESLRQRLARERQLPVEDALQISGHVLAALAYAHSHGVIHRDIKPENILLEGDQAVVADLGIAKAVSAVAGEQLTETGFAVGTPAYMSPEQASGSRELDARSDLYSVGCVLYEMLAGEPPFTGPTPQAVLAKRVLEPVPHVRTLRASVPAPLEQAITRALAQAPVDRFASATQFARALAQPLPTTPSPPTAPLAQVKAPTRRMRRVVALGLGALVAFVLGAAALLWRSRATPTALEADLVAVAPFDVLDPTLQLWHEGLVDVLSRALDGAGPLRAVSPTVIVRRWRGRADPSSAQALGHATGAGLAVYGSLVHSGADSVRLSATMLDVARERALGEVEVRGALGHMDQLIDSLAVGLLRRVGRARPVGAVRQTGLGARSLPALRAFLQAEQHYRRSAMDSAQVYAEQAVALDTTFALAYKRLARAIGWRVWRMNSRANAYAMRAGVLNHGLAPRDSLLVLIDSLTGALGASQPPSQPLAARLFAVAEEAVRRYPEDPEGWHELGEARHHFDWLVGWVGLRTKLEAFERSIALDSLYAPPYLHAVELSCALGDTARSHRLEADRIRLNPERGREEGRGLEALQRLISLRDTAAQDRMLDTLRREVLAELGCISPYDSAELDLRIGRHSLRAAQDPTEVHEAQFDLAQTLTFRGHLREALALGDSASYLLFPEAALLGYVPTERAAARFSDWLRDRSLFPAVLALPWWGARGDTAALRRFLRLADSTARAGAPNWWLRKPADDGRMAQMVTATRAASAARAQLALARGDTGTALRTYDSLLNATSPCTEWWCQGERLLAARLLVDRGRLTDAARILNTPAAREAYWPFRRPSDVLWYLERARVAERLNDRPRALEAYRYVAAAWRRPDPELEPYAAEARAAVTRLSAEPER